MVTTAAFRAAATAIWCLSSFSRLWVAVISRHWESGGASSSLERENGRAHLGGSHGDLR
jgi:hypothetical protein